MLLAVEPSHQPLWFSRIHSDVSFTTLSPSTYPVSISDLNGTVLQSKGGHPSMLSSQKILKCQVTPDTGATPSRQHCLRMLKTRLCQVKMPRAMRTVGPLCLVFPWTHMSGLLRLGSPAIPVPFYSDIFKTYALGAGEMAQ